MGAIAAVMLAVTALGSTTRDWPPFLRPSDEYPAPITNAVRRLWTDATFTRAVTADPAEVFK